MTSRYYVLGFQPEREKGPGAFHKIKVKVARKGVKLSHRPGYFERERRAAAQTVLQRQFDAAQLVVTGAGANDLRLHEPVPALPAPPARSRRSGSWCRCRTTSLPWQAGQPLAARGLRLRGGRGRHRARPPRAARARRSRAGRPRRGRRAASRSSGTFEVPPGRYTIRLMVRERDERQARGVQFLDVTVPPYDARVGFAAAAARGSTTPERWLKLEMAAASAAAPHGPPFQRRRPAVRPARELRGRTGRPRAAGADGLRARSSGRSGRRRRDPLVAHRERRARRRRPGGCASSASTDDGDGRRTFVFSYMPEDGRGRRLHAAIGLGDGAARLEAYSLIRLRAGS